MGFPSLTSRRLEVVGVVAVIDLAEEAELHNLHIVAEVAVPNLRSIQAEVRLVQEVDLLGEGVRGQQVKCPGQVAEQLLAVEEDLGRASHPTEVAHPSTAAWVAAAAVVAENWKKLLRYREAEERTTLHHDPSIHRPLEHPTGQGVRNFEEDPTD